MLPSVTMGRFCWALALAGAGCFSPAPLGGAPCAENGSCPDTLVCSPATKTCEHAGVPADAPPDAGTAAFAALSGRQWLLPCGMHDGSGTTCACASSSVGFMLQDADPRDYDVTVRIRGVVEGGMYSSATGVDEWLVGGRETTTYLGIFRIDVSRPPQHYFINGLRSDGLSVLDYTVTLPINSGATIDLVSDGQDMLELENLGSDGLPYTLAGVTTMPQPYDGEFAQIDVISAQLE